MRRTPLHVKFREELCPTCQGLKVRTVYVVCSGSRQVLLWMRWATIVGLLALALVGWAVWEIEKFRSEQARQEINRLKEMHDGRADANGDRDSGDESEERRDR